jgi:hypothetical protein
MSIVLKNQVEATERSANELLKKEHRQALRCYDLRDLLRIVVTLFRDINADVERWQNDVAEHPDEELKALSAEWHDLYRRINGICDKLSPLLRTVEDGGRKIEGKREFLIAWRELRAIVCFSQEDVGVAAEQAARGELKTLGEVRDELWDSPVPRS